MKNVEDRVAMDSIFTDKAFHDIYTSHDNSNRAKDILHEGNESGA